VCVSAELELLAISRLEKTTIEEFASAADWTTTEPWSECAEMLRERFGGLCNEIRMHLATQESLLPEMLREHWGATSPPDIVERSMEAAKRATAQGQVGSEKATLLPWCLHYLERRDPKRAKSLVGSLPFTKRLKFAFGFVSKHDKLLRHLRCIVLDEPPSEADEKLSVGGGGRGKKGVVYSARRSNQKSSGSGGDDSARGEGDEDGSDGEDEAYGAEHERQRRAGMINAVLAAANARRVDVPTAGNSMLSELAKHDQPLHVTKVSKGWEKNIQKVPDNLYQKIGIEAPKEPPRRV
jgi:hypothetical protein